MNALNTIVGNSGNRINLPRATTLRILKSKHSGIRGSISTIIEIAGKGASIGLKNIFFCTEFF